ncbi:MAG: MFS transporter [Actinophytocola sp.]|uniref:MFS transporter n=1 Tax=Actinophytocola sp. TaxID=1872138 RepID=UPI0013224E5A|nr:MFS transporter [Actinophytocola sp.]MPZ81175.1 MFS transporter [Actinophytocola sp.]
MTTLLPADPPDVTATAVATAPPDNRKVRRAWYAYDWANSVFTTIVTSTFYGPYLTDITADAADPSGYVHPLGIGVRAESLYPFLVSLSLFLQALVLPAAGALARRVPRNRLLGVLALTGAVATVALALVTESNYLAGGMLFVLATLALGASIVVYDTYLPEIAAPAERATVSARGSAAGYLGTAVILVVGAVLMIGHSAFGLEEGTALVLCLVLAGLWWAGFSTIPVRHLPPTPLRSVSDEPKVQFGRMLRELVRDRRVAAVFLVAFLLYNNAIQVLSSQGTTFVAEELEVGSEMLIGGVLFVSLLAVWSTTVAGRLATKYGGPRVLLASLGIWLLVILVQVSVQPGALIMLCVMGVLMGLVNGTGYSLSRAVFANLTPRDRSGEYFSVFEMVNRCGSAFGVLLFGAVVQLTGSYRWALGSMSLLFVGGALLLLVVGVRRPRESGLPS